MKLSSNRGISIVEVMVAMSILVGLALSSSYILTNTNVVTKRTEMKASIDQIHVLQVQRVRNSTSLKPSVQNSYLAQAGTNIGTFNSCFNNSQDVADCSNFATNKIPTTLANAQPLPPLSGTGVYAMFGESNAFESQVVWTANCSPQFCQSIDVKITTKPVSGSKYDGKLDPRITNLNFAAQLFVDQKSTRFLCTVGTEVAFNIDNRTNRATCNELNFASAAQTSCADAYPMRNFGPIATVFPADTCRNPGITDCSAGLNRGYYQVAFNSSPCRTRP